MKKDILLILTLSTTVFLSCSKNEDPGPKESNTLEASKTSQIAIGEPVTFTFSDISSAGNLKWAVTPSASAQINASGNKAAILFGQHTKYTVTAIAGGSTVSTTVSVSSDTIPGSGNPGTPPLSLIPGETFSVKLTAIDTAGSPGNSGIILYVNTTGKYPCPANRLATQLTRNGNHYTIKINGTDQIGSCNQTGNFLWNLSAYHFLAVSDGTIAVTFVVNGNTYSGTITKSGTNYTIHWPDNAVIIFPQQVTRVL